MSELNKKNPAKIVGVQFSILSPTEIRNSSVAEITSRDTYVGSKPVIGGLFDPRMGVLEPGLVCPTDGNDYIKCPGYFGHIELARPVYYIQYLTTVLKVIRCVCVKCSKLLIDKNKYKHALDMKSDLRWNYVFGLASKKKRCGECNPDGCGCKQPTKYKKEGLASIFAEWDNMNTTTEDDASKLNMKITPEMMIKIFRRISDEDVAFMGFSPIWSRPDWMICQVLAVPPPAVRPSVKVDSQQRSEDDISHILVSIIKTNNTLQEKIKQNANTLLIDDWTTLLQYYIATMVDNKMPGVASCAQRSGRCLKSIKERLNGKGGRVRGNLMGKRVDYSARSVITPDPNISIKELGVPMKIAKNITKPVIVNAKNRAFLTKLVRNGPDEYPGAKILEKKNGENISLRYVDRDSLQLNNGDTVHRHMMDGDAILFNRQPTLHRMSMMCHMARIMKVGDTFRMNVGDTKPYNADFDGDEMNLHMPQDVEAETELRNLAAVPYQIISPANNQSIIGIFQDSLLGCYRFTRNDINFTPLQAMNLLVNIKDIDEKIFTDMKKLNKQGKQIKQSKQNKTLSNFDLLSQILPALSIKNKGVEIVNGEYKKGQINKGVLGSGTTGLIQRIFNDFGNAKSVEFIDNIQHIVNEYMKSSSYSVGISDLIADEQTNQKISDVITNKKKEVSNLIDETHLGIFENNTGRSNVEEFETRVNNILNEANEGAGKIGKESLSKNNRFVIMVNAGSKGSNINISQMISCLGQQNVDGKRIPYGFENRTLPHFMKFDDTPSARGFIESSFISGLEPEELFFHAMGGRVGLIDTAVKTSQTGYIQRRLIKGMEDLMCAYDNTIRNNKNKIIQFSYGDDGIDPVKVENQNLPICSMTLEEIYSHYMIPSDTTSTSIFANNFTKSAKTRVKKQMNDAQKKSKEYVDYIIKAREDLIKHVFKYKDSDKVHLPVSFKHVINNIEKQQQLSSSSLVDITPFETYQLIEHTMNRLSESTYYKPNYLFKIMYYFYLSPTNLLMVKYFNKKSIVLLLETIELQYKQSIMAPGEMCGMIAAQSIGEPTTQMTLNTFHFAGVASKSNVTRGVPRIEEILSLSENPKNPSVTVVLKEKDMFDKHKAQDIKNKLEHTKLVDITKSIGIYFDPDDLNTLIHSDLQLIQQYKEFQMLTQECNGSQNQDGAANDDDSGKSKWVIRIELDKESMLDRNITMDEVNFAIKNSYQDDIKCVYSDFNDDKLIMRLRISNITKSQSKKNIKPKNLDQSDEIYILKNFQDKLLTNIVLRGIKNIGKVIVRKIPDSVIENNGNYEKKETWVLDTVGTNMMDILSLDYIDANGTFSNDIQEINNVLGIEAARQTIYNELAEVIEFDGTYINYHHMALLCDRMTCKSKMVSIFRHGINNDDIGPIAKASFEETPEMFLKAARHAELDNMRGVSANVMCGQEGYYGTSAFKTILNIKEMMNMEAENYSAQDDQDIEEEFNISTGDDACSISNIAIQNNLVNVTTNIRDTGNDDDYDIDF